MQRVRGDTRPLQATRERIGEHDSHQLGFGVHLEGLVSLLVGHILEWDLLASMLRRGDDNDPRWHAGLERIEEQAGEEEWGKVIEGEGHLQPITTELAANV